MENERHKLSTEVKIRILENEIDHIKDDIEDHSRTLYNDGHGIVFDVRKLKTEKESSKASWAAVLAVLSVLISLLSVIMQMLK